MAVSNENNTTDKSGLSSNPCDPVTFYGSAIDRNDPFNTEGNGTAKFIGSPSNKMKTNATNLLGQVTGSCPGGQSGIAMLTNLTSSTTKRNFRTDLSESEFYTMLCYLEGELQARDVVIATLRNERVKQLLQNTLRNNKNLTTQTQVITTKTSAASTAESAAAIASSSSSTSALLTTTTATTTITSSSSTSTATTLLQTGVATDDPQAALFRDKISSTGNLVSRQSSTTATQAELEVRACIEQQMDNLLQIVTKQRSTQLKMVKILKESLDTNQRMRQELEEEKRKHEHDTAQGDDITYGLEMERTKLKQELETEKTNRKKLEKDLKKLQETLDFERCRQKQIVLLLLAERKKVIMKYIEERKRSEDLAQILSEEKQRSDSIAEGLEEESKKSLRMEAELEKQTLAIENERKAMKLNLAKDEKWIKELEMELAQLRSENDAFRKQVATSVPLRGVPPGHNVPAPTLPAKVRALDESSSLGPTLINVAKIVQPTATVSSVPVSGPTTGIARSISPSVGFGSQPAKVTPRKLSNQISTTTPAIVGCSSGNVIQSSSSSTSSAISSSSSISSSVPLQSSSLSLSQSSFLSSSSSATLSQSSSSSPSQSIIAQTLPQQQISSSSTSSSTTLMQPTLSAPVVGSVDVVQQNCTTNSPSLNLTTSTVTLSTVPIAVGGLPVIGKVPPQAVLPNTTSQQQQQQQIVGTILRSSSNTSVISGQQQQTNSSPVIVGSAGSSNSSNVGRGVPPPIPPNKPIVPPKREPSISRIGSITANNISNPSS